MKERAKKLVHKVKDEVNTSKFVVAKDISFFIIGFFRLIIESVVAGRFPC